MAQSVVASSLMLKVSGSILGKGIIFVVTLNISELHHPKCASNMINNFDEIVSSLLTADHTCRRSEDESWEGLLLHFLILLLRYGGCLKSISKRQLLSLHFEWTMLWVGVVQHMEFIKDMICVHIEEQTHRIN